LLDPLTKLYGGTVYLSKGKEQYKWVVYRKQEINNLLNYFNIYPLRSAKYYRIKLIPEYYELKNKGAHTALSNSVLNQSWIVFLNKWKIYNDKE
jgi:hypothetical protein